MAMIEELCLRSGFVLAPKTRFGFRISSYLIEQNSVIIDMEQNQSPLTSYHVQVAKTVCRQESHSRGEVKPNEIPSPSTQLVLADRGLTKRAYTF